MIPYIFIFVTGIVVVLNERLESLVLRKFFKGILKELEEVEEKIAEYQYLSVLAVAAKDKEAYDGFQILMNEIYWPFFFRKMVFTTSLYFLLLSPYIIATNYLLSNYIPNAFSIVLFIAIAFFTIKLGYGIVSHFIESWKDAKEAERKLAMLKDR